jgi:NADH-quinone oxidoreductase subunit C
LRKAAPSPYNASAKHPLFVGFEASVSTFALDQIQAQIPNALVERYSDKTGGAWGVILPARMADVAKLLKEKLGFRLFVSMDAVDRLHLPDFDPTSRFEVLYFFRNIDRGAHLHLKVFASEADEIASIRRIYQGAAWAERFVWDFYGVRFAGGEHRRMLMYDEFEGHPLRKDYPLRGRQPLIPERPLEDIYRGPGTNGVSE